jgi:uncharacterized protein
MKKLILIVFTAISLNLSAQDIKIVMQLTSGDTLVQKALMKQLGNITSVEPGVQIEVICHGPGLNLLVKDKTIVADKIAAMAEKGIKFKACEFSLKERKIDKSELLSEAEYVEAGILAIVRKQMDGWHYIKAGF